MFSELRSFLDKKNIINLLIAGILILGIPIAVQLVKQQQLIKSRADVIPVEVVEDGTRVVKRVVNGRERLVATTQTVTVRLRTPAEFLVTGQANNMGVSTAYAQEISSGGDCSAASTAGNCGENSNLYCRKIDTDGYKWMTVAEVNSRCTSGADTAQCSTTTSYCWDNGNGAGRVWHSDQPYSGKSCSAAERCLPGTKDSGGNELFCRKIDNDSYKWMTAQEALERCQKGAQTAQCSGNTYYCWDDGRGINWHNEQRPAGSRAYCILYLSKNTVRVGEEFTAGLRLSREPEGNERGVIRWGTSDDENTLIAPGDKKGSEEGIQYDVTHKYTTPGTYTITASLDDRITEGKTLCNNISVSDRQKQITVVSATGPTCPADRTKVDGCVDASGRKGTQWCTRGDTSGCTEAQKGCFDASTGGTKGACKVEAAGPVSCDPITRNDCTVDGRSGKRTCKPAGEQCGRTTEECGECTPISGAPTSTVERVVKFKISEDLASLDSAPEFTFAGDGMTVDFPFLNTTPGEKFIFVRFIGANGRTVDKRTSVFLVGPDPVITNLGCNVDVQNNSLIFTALGFNFGTRDFERSSLSADGSPLEIREWISLTPGPQAGRVIARLLSPPDVTLGHTYVVTLTRGDGVRTTSTCNVGTTTVAFSTKMQCRVPGQFSANNVDVKIFGTGPNPILRQKINLDKDGNPQGFTPKLELNKVYTLIIKPPGTLAKRQVFQTGSGGTVNLEPITLPVGDIGPRESPDGVVNAIDASELKRQWSLVSDVTRTGDFNQDSRINSLDYSCLIKNINASDEIFTLSTTPQSPPTAGTNRNFSVSGRVFFDANSDNTFNIGESVVAGITVRALRQAPPEVPGQLLTPSQAAAATVLGQATTDANGVYSMALTPPNTILNLVMWVDPGGSTGQGGQKAIGIGAFPDSYFITRPLVLDIPLLPSP